MFDWLKKKKAGDQPFSAKKAHVMLDLAIEKLAVKVDDVVLVVGFGNEVELMMYLVTQLDKGRLAGIEPNQAAMDRAINIFDEEFKNFKADFKNAVVSKIPFYDGSFTKVISLDQMHTWINIDRGFDEINRVLAPGGIFVLVWGIPADHDTQIEGRPIISAEEVTRIMKTAGFYHPELRERVEGPLKYFMLTSRKL